MAACELERKLMPAHTRKDEIADLAHAALRRVFAEEHWTTEQIRNDYGEDFLVKVFDRGEATPFCCFIQSKSTDHLSRYLSKDGKTIHFPVSIKHFNNWSKFLEPVVLAVYDARSEKTFWQIVQKSLPERQSGNRKSIRIKVPLRNQFDRVGLRRLRAKTQVRFHRLETQIDAMQSLISHISKHWGVKIIFDSEKGSIEIPCRQFLHDPSGRSHVVIVGRVSRFINQVSLALDRPSEDWLLTFRPPCIRKRLKDIATQDAEAWDEWLPFSGTAESFIDRANSYLRKAEAIETPKAGQMFGVFDLMTSFVRGLNALEMQGFSAEIPDLLEIFAFRIGIHELYSEIESRLDFKVNIEDQSRYDDLMMADLISTFVGSARSTEMPRRKRSSLTGRVKTHQAEIGRSLVFPSI